MCKCFSKFLITIMSCITIGLCLAVSLAIFLVIKKEQIHEVSKNVEIGLIVTIAVSGAVFLFALYASCCGKKCAKKTLATIFAVYALALLALAAFAWGYKNKLVENVGLVWKQGESYNVQAIDQLEKAFNCCGFDDGLGCGVGTKRCKTLIEENLDLVSNVLGSFFIIISVLLIICIVLLCSKKCCKNKVGDDSDYYP